MSYQLNVEATAVTLNVTVTEYNYTEYKIRELYKEPIWIQVVLRNLVRNRNFSWSRRQCGCLLHRPGTCTHAHCHELLHSEPGGQ